MGTIEISDGVSTRRIRVADLRGVVKVDCSGSDPTVVVPDGVEVDREGGDDLVDDPGVSAYRGP
jgi:hypothetical protein